MATKTVQEETVERLEIPVRFAARRSQGLRLVLTPRQPLYGQGGERIGQTEGLTVEFSHGLFETDDPALVEKLRSHPQRDREFVEIGAEPDRVPSSEPVIEAILKATAELDAPALEAIKAEEESGHNRPDVMTAVQAAIRRVHGQEPAGA